MSLVLALLQKLPFAWRAGLIAGAVLAVLGGFAGLYAAGHHAGREQANLQWQVKWDERELALGRQRFAELDRQATINAEAKAKEAAALAAYQQQLLVMAELAQRLAEEAAADPEADRLALDADAVARYNRRIAR